MTRNLAELYRGKVSGLQKALNAAATRAEAAEALRRLIDEIRLVPGDGALQIELKGDLAAILALTSEHPRAGVASGVQTTPVAGQDLFKNVPTRP